MLKPFGAKFASLKSVMLLFIIIVGFNGYFMVTMSESQSLPPLDLNYAYSPKIVYKTLDSMDDTRRNHYMVGEITSDIIYPIIYTLFFSFSLLLLFKDNELVPFLPYVTFLSDIMENISIVGLIKFYPQHINWLAWLASIFSTIKWLFVAITFLLLIYGLARKLFFKPKPI